MSARKCMHDGCGYPPLGGKRKCYWHDLDRLPIEEQIAAAERRRAETLEHPACDGVPVARVSKALWPEGERWCAGCQDFVPLWYCRGSRCRADASRAAHGARTEKLYGITREEYEELLEFQGGRCYICRQLPRKRRLAVDHDHAASERAGRPIVRGLLCADNDRGCNHAVLGSLEARAVDSAALAALRAVEYLVDPPYNQMQRAKTGAVAPLADGRVVAALQRLSLYAVPSRYAAGADR